MKTARVIVIYIFCCVYSLYLNLKTNRFVKTCKLMNDSHVNVNNNNLNVEINVKISVSKSLN